MPYERAASAQDVTNLISAILLFLSPWGLGFASDMPAAWTAWAGGAAIALMAAAALMRFAEWEEWVALVVGLAVAASPWAFQFAAIRNAVIAFVVLGAVVALSAITEIWTGHSDPGLTARL